VTAEANSLPKTVVIGWREFLGLPDWGIRKIKAKVDTGARTSALHVDNLEFLHGNHVRFDVVVREEPRRMVRVEAPIHRMSRVRPNHDRLEERPVVLTHMKLGALEYPIEVSLVGRPGMLCRMLLGRRALAQGILVDSSRRYLLSGPNGPEKAKS